MAKFKVDENLPRQVAALLVDAGYDAVTVLDQAMGGRPDEEISRVCLKEERVLVTLDIGFGDIRTYPPSTYPGIIILRPDQSDMGSILSLMRRLLPVLEAEPLAGKLLIVEPERVRVRE